MRFQRDLGEEAQRRPGQARCSTATRRLIDSPGGTGTSARTAHARGTRQAIRRRRLRAREHHRLPVRRPGRGHRSGRHRRSDRALDLPVEPASTASTPSSSTTGIPSPTGFKWRRHRSEPSNLLRCTRREHNRGRRSGASHSGVPAEPRTCEGRGYCGRAGRRSDRGQSPPAGAAAKPIEAGQELCLVARRLVTGDLVHPAEHRSQRLAVALRLFISTVSRRTTTPASASSPSPVPISITSNCRLGLSMKPSSRERLRSLAQAHRPTATRCAQKDPVAWVSGNAAAST